MTLPAPSCGCTSQTEFQLPMSDQPKIDRKHRGPLGTLHYRVVDRFLGRLRERPSAEAQEIEIGGHSVDAPLCRRR